MSVVIDPIRTSGPALRPGDDGYDDETTGYNLIVRHRPALVVGATGPDDVVAAVRYARDRGLPVAVQATGHGPSVPADGAVFVSTRRMDGVDVDPERRTARVAAGVRSGALVAAAADHGLAPLNGSAPDVGVVSYTLSGGVPMLGRRFGYAADHVRSLDVVTADGELRHVTADREPDLFWALRGGRGNFGVVVALETQLFPVSRLYGGGLWFAGDAIRPALHAYADWAAGVPEEMGSSVLLIHTPDIDGLADPLRDRFVAHVRIAWSGPDGEGERWVRPLREAAAPVLDTLGDMPYREVGSIHDEPTTPVPFHSRNTMLRRIDHDAVDRLLEVAGPDAGVPYFVELRQFGGALARPPAVPDALGRRDGEFSLYSGSIVAPGELDAHRAAHDALHATMRPWGTGGVCLNFLTGPDVTTDELRSGYLTGDLARLVDLKRRYDPDDLFRVTHSLTAA